MMDTINMEVWVLLGSSNAQRWLCKRVELQTQTRLKGRRAGAVSRAGSTPSGCCNSSCLPVKMRRCRLESWPGSQFSMLSEGYTSKVPVSVLTKIRVPPRRRSTRCKVDSFWML